MIGRGTQSNAPALLPHGDAIITGWVNTDTQTGEYDILQYISTINITQREANTTFVPAPPVIPHDQQIYPAEGGLTHLIWKDIPWDDLTHGIVLWSSLMRPDLSIELGPVRLTQQVVYQVDTLADESGGVWLAWTSEPRAEPTLYLQYLDSAGRPRLPGRLHSDVQWPALTDTPGGELRIFWLQDRDVYSAAIRENALEDMRAITSNVTLDPGDLITDFSAGSDQNTIYLLWNITRAGGNAETWFTTSVSSSEAWTPPQQLGLTINPETTLATEYNGGDAQAATSGETWLKWGAMIAGEAETMVIAGQINEAVGVAYFQSGEIIGYQQLVEINASGLIGTPTLYTDSDSHLYLAWAESIPGISARLRLTTTR